MDKMTFRFTGGHRSGKDRRGKSDEEKSPIRNFDENGKVRRRGGGEED